MGGGESLFLGGTFRQFDEPVLFLIVGLAIVGKLFRNVVVPLFLQLVIEAVLGLIIILPLDVQVLLDCPIKGLRH